MNLPDEVKMKILLLSLGLGALDRFLPPPAKIGFVPTAGETYAEPTFVVEDRKRLGNLGYDLIDLDISNAPRDQLLAQMAAVDGIFVAGGNSFYLMQQIRERQILDPLRDFILAGRPFIGTSAGAVICGPSLEPVATLDNPEDAPRLATRAGLNVVDFVVLPHFGKQKYLDRYNAIIEQYSGTMITIPLRDDQAIIVKSKTEFEITVSALILHDA